jgi:hypothetical protein
MHRTHPDEAARFEQIASAKGVPLLAPISCLPDGCDDEDAILVVARASTRNEAAELLPKILNDDAQALVNHAMAITLAVDGQTGAGVVEGIKRLSDLSDDFIPHIVDESFSHLGILRVRDIFTEILSSRTTPEDVAKFGLPPDILSLLEKYRDPGGLRMIRAGSLPSVVVARPTGDAHNTFEKAARGNRTWGAYINHAFTHIVFPASEEAKRRLFEQWPGFGLNVVNVLRQMRSGGARAEGKGGPKLSVKREG